MTGTKTGIFCTLQECVAGCFSSFSPALSRVRFFYSCLFSSFDSFRPVCRASLQVLSVVLSATCSHWEFGLMSTTREEMTCGAVTYCTTTLDRYTRQES